MTEPTAPVPTCIGFIMDGNRRWAKECGLPTLEGHRKGHEIFQDMVRYVRDVGIAHAVFYAFSTENWNRSEPEVAYLMELFASMLQNMSEQIEQERVRIRIIGRRTDFSAALQSKMSALEESSAQYADTTIWVALSYGGRTEIIEAVNTAVEAGGPIDENSFKALLWSAELPDPDIIVRTSGEQRLSGFMTWGSVYSELYFIEKHWPALTKKDFDDILTEYGTRQRRTGI